MLNKIASRLSKTDASIYFGEERTTISKFKRDGLTACFPTLAKELGVDTAERYKQIEIAEKLVPILKRRVQEMPVDVDTKEQTETFFKGNILFQDLRDSKELLAFNLEERKVIKDVDPNIFLRKLGKEKKLTKILNLPLATTTYDAYNSKALTAGVKYGIKTNYLNLYRPPLWRVTYPEAKPEWLASPPELFKRFLNYLVPNNLEQDILLSWLSWALVERHHSYLVLRGNRGNGKTIFMKTMMGVIGDYYLALNGVVSDFNADLKHKRIVGIDDDAEIGTYNGNKLRKKLINTMVTYNEKHKQTNESEEQFTSYIICSNPSEKFYLEYDERRVVHIDLTKEKMNDHFTQKERNFLDTLAMDESKLKPKQIEFLAHLGHYILSKSKSVKYSYDLCHKGGTFWHDVVESLNGFNRMAVEKILLRESDTYSFTRLCMIWKEDKTSRQNTPSWNTFKHFIETFQFKDETLIESVNNKTKAFKVADRYLPENEESMDLDDIDI